MSTYLSLLRGINVGGHRSVKMEQLKALYAGLGCRKVQTYIQSGNIIFQSEEVSPQELAKALATAIAEKYAFDVPVVVMELNELRQIVADNPYRNEKAKEASCLHVTFLAEVPGREKTEQMQREVYLPEEFSLAGRAVYLYCPNGYGNSRLTNGFFEHRLQVAATTRNWKTVNELLRLAEEIAAG